jgi:hypothetical protein
MQRVKVTILHAPWLSCFSFFTAIWSLFLGGGQGIGFEFRAFYSLGRGSTTWSRALSPFWIYTFFFSDFESHVFAWGQPEPQSSHGAGITVHTTKPSLMTEMGYTNFLPGLALTKIILLSVSWVAGIRGVHSCAWLTMNSMEAKESGQDPKSSRGRLWITPNTSCS